MKALYINQDGSIRIDDAAFEGKYPMRVVKMVKRQKGNYAMAELQYSVTDLTYDIVEYFHRGEIGPFEVYEEQ